MDINNKVLSSATHAARRRIILLSDGTGNSAGKLFRTNVWRFYQALDLSNAQQIARYDDGIGTSSFKPFAILGGAIGWGLKRNLLDLYVFLCRNYREGDDIYALGFSRGAFTARVLIKFVLSQGIVSDFYSDDDLRWKARQLYRNFRRERRTRLGVATAGRAIRDAFVWMIARYFRRTESEISTVKPAEIKFVGVWDTVDAYGLPIYELKKGIDRFIWPLALEDRVLDSRIGKACHALSIDDKRKTFHPLLWDEADAQRFPSVGDSDEEKLTQVFFAGVHSNVGGGYPDDGLSYVSLNWMMKEASKAGVKFDRTAIRQINSATAPFGKLYNSRAGIASYYRYEPRELSPPCDSQSNEIPHPKIHESVLIRMAMGTDAYAPLGLPSNCRVVVESSWNAILRCRKLQKNILSFDEYESSSNSTDLAYIKFGMSGSGTNVIARVKAPDKSSTELIWDTVWWRRIAYFMTLFVSACLVASPIFSVLDNFPIFKSLLVAFRMDNTSAVLDILSSPIILFVSDTASRLMPNFLAPWVQAFRSEPSNFLILSTLLGACFLWSSLIDRRISDRSLAAWNFDWSERRANWFKASLTGRCRTALVFALSATSLLLWIILLVLEESRCSDNDSLCFVRELYETVLRLTVSGILLVIIFIAASWFVALLRMIQQGGPAAAERRGIALGIAQKIRKSSILLGTFNLIASQAVPAVFALTVALTAVLGSIFLINRTAFIGFSATGEICVPTTKKGQEALAEPTIIVLQFGRGCQATGVVLRDGSTYEIGIQDDPSDAEESDAPAEIKEARELERKMLSEYPKNDALPEYHGLDGIVAMPFRRALFGDWFTPILRVGETGNQEYLITQANFTVSPNRSGEAFLYLNNIVLGWRSIYDFFYQQKGSIKIAIKPRKK